MEHPNLQHDPDYTSEELAFIKKNKPSVYATYMARLHLDQGFEEESQYWRSLFPSDPYSLLAIKIDGGKEAVINGGFNTELADKEFGHGWLDR